MPEKKNDENIIDIVRAMCALQFVVILIVVNFIPNLDRKLIILLSAVFGILVSGAVSRNFIRNKVTESIKPLGEDFYKTGKISPDPEDKNKS